MKIITGGVLKTGCSSACTLLGQAIVPIPWVGAYLGSIVGLVAAGFLNDLLKGRQKGRQP